MTLEVIGAGLGRTGTLSLKAALDILGYEPCYHMLECVMQGPEHWKLWEAAQQGARDWDTIFAGRSATVDFPACTSWKALAEHYPHAKVVLGVRDPECWYESTQQTIFAPRWIDYLSTSIAADFVDTNVNSYFEGRMHDKEYLVQRFKDHVAEVQATIPAERLLTFKAEDGWKPLCKFLDRPVPDQPFPHIEDSEEARGIIDTIIEEGFEDIFNF
jgi:hypothetical protein